MDRIQSIALVSGHHARLSHSGQYDGINGLFAETTPACPVCGLSLSPDHVVSEANTTPCRIVRNVLKSVINASDVHER